MKKFIRTMLGVTLLEVLLVLVIASLVLVMSIRYYQTATTQAKVNSAMESITGIIAAADTYINAGNSIGNVSVSTLAPYLPGGVAPNNPWGTGGVTIVGSGSSYTITFPGVPADACASLKASAEINKKISSPNCGVITVSP